MGVQGWVSLSGWPLVKVIRLHDIMEVFHIAGECVKSQDERERKRAWRVGYQLSSSLLL